MRTSFRNPNENVRIAYDCALCKHHFHTARRRMSRAEAEPEQKDRT